MDQTTGDPRSELERGAVLEVQYKTTSILSIFFWGALFGHFYIFFIYTRQVIKLVPLLK